MAGLLAWAADVVGGGAIDDSPDSIPIIFSEQQRKYVQELDHKASSLRRSIHDLRLRLPPQDISQSLPQLHAHSLASNAALTLQLNAHSSTRQQVRSLSLSYLNQSTFIFILMFIHLFIIVDQAYEIL